MLSVTALAGCPADDDDDGSSTQASASESSSTTNAPTTSTTMSSTETSTSESSGASSEDSSESSGVDTSSSSGETGEIPTCTDLADEPTCGGETQCIWLPELGGCIRNCEMITDLAVCMESPGCEVYEETCGYEPIE